MDLFCLQIELMSTWLRLGKPWTHRACAQVAVSHEDIDSKECLESMEGPGRQSGKITTK